MDNFQVSLGEYWRSKYIYLRGIKKNIEYVCIDKKKPDKA